MSAASTEEMLRNADLAMYAAMYAAKNAGKSGWRMYRSDLHAEVANRVRLESDLRDTLAQGQYVLYYQAITTRPSAVPARAACTRSRHCCAGSTRPAGWSRRARSFPRWSRPG